MKIIHTADLHLDSPLGNVANGKERRKELFDAFKKMVDFATNNNIDAVIVAGDLFDSDFVANDTVKSVAEIINNSNLMWFVLQGNHGSNKPYNKLFELAPSINHFGDEWMYYNFDGVTIVGRELGNADKEQYAKLTLNSNNYNIVVLHGDVDSDSYGLIDVKALSQSGANYVALGHRHTFASYKWGKTIGAYCGVLESRGFDEDGETGFVLVDTQERATSFVKQSYRRVVTVNIDITGIDNTVQLENRLEKQTEDISEKNYLNVILDGERNENVDAEDIAKSYLYGKFYAVRVQDNSTLAVDLEKLMAEVSVKGEFAKLANNLPGNIKSKVLALGLKALSGEKLQ